MNTIGTGTYSSSYRAKYFQNTFNAGLRNLLIAEKICTVDRTDSKYIHNPYGTQPTALVQALAGTYAVSAYTLTDDSLTVTDEFIYSVHVYDFERVMANFDLMAFQIDDITYAVAAAIDKWVLNEILDQATGTYSTPTGGFTTSANLNVIISNLLSKVAGYESQYKGTFLVLENTDITGVIQSQMASGYSYADSALNNGLLTTIGGVEIFVVKSGTFVSATTTSVSGTKTWTNSGHRLFGVKGIATYASPRGVQFEEKGVSGKTGKEIVVYGYCGAKLWTPKAALLVDITLS